MGGRRNTDVQDRRNRVWAVIFAIVSWKPWIPAGENTHGGNACGMYWRRDAVLWTLEPSDEDGFTVVALVLPGCICEGGK
jgi:hypothetical protein